VRAVYDGVSAVTFDLAASFWQAHLPAQTQLYVVGVDGQVYRILRLPYGIDAASEIVHLLVSEVARLAAMTASVRMYVQIDNVMAVGSLIDTTAFAAAFKSSATSFAMTLNDEPGNLPAPTTTFAGIRFDFVGNSVRLVERLVAPLLLVHPRAVAPICCGHLRSTSVQVSLSSQILQTATVRLGKGPASLVGDSGTSSLRSSRHTTVTWSSGRQRFPHHPLSARSRRSATG
jgi:hypothetical protein